MQINKGTHTLRETDQVVWRHGWAHSEAADGDGDVGWRQDRQDDTGIGRGFSFLLVDR